MSFNPINSEVDRYFHFLTLEDKPPELIIDCLPLDPNHLVHLFNEIICMKEEDKLNGDLELIYDRLYVLYDKNDFSQDVEKLFEKTILRLHYFKTRRDLLKDLETVTKEQIFNLLLHVDLFGTEKIKAKVIKKIQFFYQLSCDFSVEISEELISLRIDEKDLNHENIHKMIVDLYENQKTKIFICPKSDRTAYLETSLVEFFKGISKINPILTFRLASITEFENDDYLEEILSEAFDNLGTFEDWDLAFDTLLKFEGSDWCLTLKEEAILDQIVTGLKVYIEQETVAYKKIQTVRSIEKKYAIFKESERTSYQNWMRSFLSLSEDLCFESDYKSLKMGWNLGFIENVILKLGELTHLKVCCYDGAPRVYISHFTRDFIQSKLDIFRNLAISFDGTLTFMIYLEDGFDEASFKFFIEEFGIYIDSLVFCLKENSDQWLSFINSHKTSLKNLRIISSNVTEVKDLPKNLKELHLEDLPLIKHLGDSFNTPHLELLKIKECPSLSFETKLHFYRNYFKYNFKNSLTNFDQLFLGDQEAVQALYSFISKHHLSLIQNGLSLFQETLNENSYLCLLEHLLTHHFDETVSQIVWTDFIGECFSKIQMFKTYEESLKYKYIDKKVKSAFELDLKVESPENVELNELLVLFEEINFSDKNTPLFIDLRNFLEDSGEFVDQEYLTQGLQNILSRIASKEKYSGVPSDDQDRFQWYDKLESLLKHLIKQGKTIALEKKLRFQNELISIAIGGHHCGERWLGTVLEALESLQERIHIEDLSLESAMIHWLDSYKEGFIQTVANLFKKPNPALEPHYKNRISLFLLKHQFSLKNEAFINLKDSYIDETNVSDECIQGFIDICFHPLMIAKYIRNHIHESSKENPGFIPTVLVPFHECAKERLISLHNAKRKERDFTTDESTSPSKKLKKDSIDQEMIDTYLRDQDWVRMDEMMIETTFTLKGVLNVLDHLNFFKRIS